MRVNGYPLPSCVFHSLESKLSKEKSESAAIPESELGRYCCKRTLKVVDLRDSVSWGAICDGADDDGAAQPGPGPAVL